MDNFRKAMIEELMLTLKIPQGSFNFGTIVDEIALIPNENLKGFYKKVVGLESFGNGMKLIMQTASSFKTATKIDDLNLNELGTICVKIYRRQGKSEEQILRDLVEAEQIIGVS